MIDIQGLIETDRLATLALNGSDSLYLDGVAHLYTTIFIWIPLALFAIYMILRNVEARRIIPVLLLLVITVVICDRVSSGLAKPMFERFRPTRDPVMMDMVDTVNGYRGGRYGFFSGHAANSFGLAVLFMWLVRDWWFGLSVGLWATLNSLIRTYLGVHFLGDILVGAIFGTLVGTLVYWAYRLFASSKSFSFVHIDRYSNKYSGSGFLKSDIYGFLICLYGTFAVIMIAACITQGIA